MSIMEQFGFPSTRDAKSKLLSEMRKLGAVRLEAHYSGGNDEGGVDDVALFDAEDNKMEAPKAWIKREPRAGDQPWEIRNGVVNEYHPLWEAADAMLSTEFGSWAGDWTAYGILFADTRNGRVHREGEMSSYSGDGNEY